MKNDFYFLLDYAEKRKYANKMRAMHLMASILILVYAVLLISNWETKWMEVVALIPAAVGIVVFVLWKKKEAEQFEINRILRLLEAGVLGMAGGYFYNEVQYFIAGFYFFGAVFMLVLLYLEYRLFDEHFIELTPVEIKVPTMFATKKVLWGDVKNVMLKYNLFTIHLKDDTFIQQQVYHMYDENELSQFENFLNRQL